MNRYQKIIETDQGEIEVAEYCRLGDTTYTKVGLDFLDGFDNLTFDKSLWPQIRTAIDEAVAHEGVPPSADTTTADLRADYGADRV